MTTNSSKKLHGCTLYTMQPRNFDTQKCNRPYNLAATINLKGLTKQCLEKNQQYNFDATRNKNKRNFITKNLRNSFTAKYSL